MRAQADPHTSRFLCVVSLPRFGDLDGQPNISRLLNVGNSAARKEAVGALAGPCGFSISAASTSQQHPTPDYKPRPQQAVC